MSTLRITCPGSHTRFLGNRLQTVYGSWHTLLRPRLHCLPCHCPQRSSGSSSCSCSQCRYALSAPIFLTISLGGGYSVGSFSRPCLLCCHRGRLVSGPSAHLSCSKQDGPSRNLGYLRVQNAGYSYRSGYHHKNFTTSRSPSMVP